MTEVAKKSKPRASRTGIDVESVGQQDAARVIGRSAVRLRDHPQVGGRKPDGRYDLPALVKGYMRDVLGEDSTVSDQQLKRDLIVAQTERERSTAARNVLAIAKERAELISRRDVEQTVQAILSSASERIMPIGDKIAPGIPADLRTDLVETIRSDCARVQVSMSEDLRQRVIPAAPDVEDGA